jgi:tetratricopeptide (TPR) repeat protein
MLLERPGATLAIHQIWYQRIPRPFPQAIELDESFALAYSMVGTVHCLRRQSGWMIDVAQECAEAIRLARLAIELGQLDEDALCRAGLTIAYLAGELDWGAECIRRGLAMNPNHAIGWHNSAWVQLYLGKHQTALDHVSRYQRLSPLDPYMRQATLQVALAHLFQGHYEKAAHLAAQITAEFPAFLPSWRLLAVSKALAGDIVSANNATRKALELDPSHTVSALLTAPYQQSDIDRLTEGYIRAGFPR